MLFTWCVVHEDGKYNETSIKVSWIAIENTCGIGINVLGEGTIEMPEGWHPGKGSFSVFQAACKNGLNVHGGPYVLQQI